MAKELITSAELASRLGVSESTISKRVGAGELPSPLYVAGKRCWQSETIDSYIQAAAAVADRTTLEKGNSMTSTIPAASRIHAPLRAYDNEQDAYLVGNFILAAVYGNQDAAKKCLKYGLRVQGLMSTGSNSGGGHLVPQEMQKAIVNIREARGVFPKFANTVPMSSDIATIPRLLTDVTVAWSSEGQEATASDPTLGAGEMMSKKLIALTKVSSEVDEDAVIDVAETVTKSMAYGMADKVDQAAFNGDGTSTYGGILGLANALDTAAIKVAAVGNDSANALDLDDFTATVALCPQYEGAENAWFMHSAVYFSAASRLLGGQVLTMTLDDGRVVPSWLGYPVIFTQAMPSTVTALPSTILAYYGDLRLGTTYGVRRSARTEITSGRYFEHDLLGIKSAERIAISIHERGDTVRNRPVVALKTAAA